MRLDNMILTDFASAVMSPVNSNGEQTTRGTITFVDPDNDKNVEVLIDGTYGGKSTAATTMVKCEVDDRVMVLIKNHKATVIGNISSPVLKKVTANDIEAGAVTADTISGTWFYNNEKTSWINLKEGKLNFDGKLIWDGTNLSINGNIESDTGKIGGWSILKTQIHKSTITGGYEYRPLLHAPDSPSGGTTAFGVAVRTNDGHGTTGNWSYPFTVSYDGSLKATNADITGKITAIRGKIAGFDIDGNNLRNGDYVVLEAYNGSYGGGRLRLGPEMGAHSALSNGGLVVYAANGSGSFVYPDGISTPRLSTTSGEISEAGALLKNKYARLGAANTYTGSQMVNATSGMVGVHYTGTSWLGAGIHAASSGRNGVWSLGYGTPANNSQSGQWLIFRDTDGTVKTRNYVGGESYPVVSTTMDKQIVTTLRTTNATTFAVRGQWGASGTNVEWKNITSSASDPKLKKNIKDTAVNAIDILNKIKLHSFDWKADDVHWDVGFIAPELYEIDKAMAVKPIDDDTAWSVNDFYLLGMSVKAIQELSSKVDYLERRINERGN